MEKAFRIENNANYYINLDKYINNTQQQRKLIKEFFKTHDIEATRYYLRGDGFVNVPFDEYEKEEIVLSISPTDNDKSVFSKMLCKLDEHDMCAFKKKSKINKEFQNYCVETQMIINLSEPDLRDYLKSMDWKRYSRSLFKFNDYWYLKVESDLLKDDDVPEGFIDIKMSEFYEIKEKYESEDK